MVGTAWNGGLHQSSAEWSASKLSLCIEETLTTTKVSVLKVSTVEAEDHWCTPSQQPPPGVQGRPAGDPGVQSTQPALRVCVSEIW